MNSRLVLNLVAPSAESSLNLTFRFGFIVAVSKALCTIHQISTFGVLLKTLLVLFLFPQKKTCAPQAHTHHLAPVKNGRVIVVELSKKNPSQSDYF